MDRFDADQSAVDLVVLKLLHVDRVNEHFVVAGLVDCTALDQVVIGLMNLSDIDRSELY